MCCGPISAATICAPPLRISMAASAASAGSAASSSSPRPNDHQDERRNHMSNRQTKTDGVRFEPVRSDKPRPGGGWILAIGVIYPGIVVAIELATHICAKSLFDPLPTYWHVAAVVFVLVSNFLMWAHLEF